MSDKVMDILIFLVIGFLCGIVWVLVKTLLSLVMG